MIPASLAGKVRRAPAFWVARRMVSLPSEARFVSITFDDFPSTALDEGGRVLDAEGVSATFYAAFGLAGSKTPVGRVGSLDELAACVARGHEIGCHTYDHCNCSVLAESEVERTILRNRSIAHELRLPRFRNFSYPFGGFGAAAKRVAMRHYLSARRSTPGINRDRIDLGMLKSAPVYSHLGRSHLEALLASVASRGGWLILHSHDVCANPSRFGCVPADLAFVIQSSRKIGAKIMTVDAVLQELRAESSRAA